MAKITVSRIFELSKYLATKSGQELKDALTYISEFAEVSLRTLNKGLTFPDNFDCEIKTVTVRDGREQRISFTTKKRVASVMIRKVINDIYYEVESFGWKYAPDGNVIIIVNFTGSPASTLDITIELLILFG